MRRYFSIMVITAAAFAMAAALLHQRADAQVPTATLSPVQTVSRATLTDFSKLVQSGASEATIRSWARTHRLEIVSLKGFNVTLAPQQPPSIPPTGEGVSACDHRKCPIGGGGYPVYNTKGQTVGWQTTTCTASSCKWVYNQALKSWTRLCGGWTCKNEGSVIDMTGR